jgi:hypothetical protein
MKQGLFLDGVGVGRDNLVVVERIQDAVDIFTDGASARFAFRYQAAVRTQKALRLFAFRRLPQDSSFQHTLPAFVGQRPTEEDS